MEIYQISHIKPFTDFYNCDGIKYPTVINNNDYTLNPWIVLIVLYIDVDFEPFKRKGELQYVLDHDDNDTDERLSDLISLHNHLVLY